jgi:Domain of unknown function (DUF1839)
MSRVEAIAGLAAETFQRHSLHGGPPTDQGIARGDGADRPPVWVEKNCYIDLWIEALHALRLEPLAMLPFTLAVDFEGDQWTFFKPSLEELRDLYGIDVQELTVWRPLVEHAVEHLSAGKLVSTEADAFWLPDTAGTDYRNQHSKTTILLNSIDVDARRLGYFHNAGYFELAGEDFSQLFRLERPLDAEFLPLLAELVRIDRLVRHPPNELATRSFALLRRHFDRRPATNPFHRFAERFARDLPELQTAGLPYYHAWAFASIRQAGAAFDLLAANLRWQAGFGRPELIAAAECFDAIAEGNKALILKGARAVNSGRPFDAAPIFEGMAAAWDRGMALLDGALAPASK